MKKLIAIICLIVLSIQVLPVEQIGTLLGSNSVNEELPHNFSTEKSADLKFESTGYDVSLSSQVVAENNALAYIHFTSSIPDNHQGEIHTPPPNFV